MKFFILLILFFFNFCSSMTKYPLPNTSPNDNNNSSGGGNGGETLPPPINGQLSHISKWTLSENIPNSSRTVRELAIDKENNNIYIAFVKTSTLYIYQLINNRFSFISSINNTSKLLDMKIFNGQIYISYIENGNSTALVKKYNGSSWVTPGGNVDVFIGITAANLEVHNSRLYIAYIDSNKKAQLMYLNNNQWEIQGNANPLEVRRSAGNIQLAFHNNIPYMFIARNSSRLPVVLKLNNNTWENIFGIAPSGSKSIDQYMNLLIQQDGTIYISYINSIALLNGEFQIFSYKDNKWTRITSLINPKVFGQQITLYQNQLFTVFGKQNKPYPDVEIYQNGPIIFNKIVDSSTYKPFPNFSSVTTGDRTGQYPSILIDNNMIYILFVYNSSALKLAISKFTS